MACLFKLIGKLVGIIQVFISRLVFVAFCFYMLTQVVILRQSDFFWLLFLPLAALMIETLNLLFSICCGNKNRNADQHSKIIFFPSVFFYLCCAVPCVWLILLHTCPSATGGSINNSFDTGTRISSTTLVYTSTSSETNSTNPTRSSNSCTREARTATLKTMQQLLVFFLAFGKWVEPTDGKVSDEKLTQMLLSALGSGADIVDIVSTAIAFKPEEGIFKNIDIEKIADYLVLTIWTLSLLQYTFLLQSKEAGKSKKKKPKANEKKSNVIGCLAGNPKMVQQGINVLLQDIPFLAIRGFIISTSRGIDADIVFFISKNALVVLLTIFRFRNEYRRYKQKNKRPKNAQKTESAKSKQSKNDKKDDDGDDNNDNDDNNSEDVEEASTPSDKLVEEEEDDDDEEEDENSE